MPRLAAFALFAAATLAAGAALAQSPVYKDAERFDETRWRGGGGQGEPAPDLIGPRRPPRPVMGGPGYSGSEYGLGKPSFNGLGSRPDWGRSGL